MSTQQASISACKNTTAHFILSVLKWNIVFLTDALWRQVFQSCEVNFTVNYIWWSVIVVWQAVEKASNSIAKYSVTNWGVCLLWLLFMAQIVHIPNTNTTHTHTHTYLKYAPLSQSLLHLFQEGLMEFVHRFEIGKNEISQGIRHSLILPNGLLKGLESYKKEEKQKNSDYISDAFSYNIIFHLLFYI